MQGYTLQINIRGPYGDPSIARAMDLGPDEIFVGNRTVEELKMGVVGMDQAVRIMRVREFRRKAIVAAATRLAQQLCDRLEDAEGWHDPSRVEPARKSLGLPAEY